MLILPLIISLGLSQSIDNSQAEPTFDADGRLVEGLLHFHIPKNMSNYSTWSGIDTGSVSFDLEQCNMSVFISNGSFVNTREWIRPIKFGLYEVDSGKDDAYQFRSFGGWFLVTLWTKNKGCAEEYVQNNVTLNSEYVTVTERVEYYYDVVRDWFER